MVSIISNSSYLTSVEYLYTIVYRAYFVLSSTRFDRKYHTLGACMLFYCVVIVAILAISLSQPVLAEGFHDNFTVRGRSFPPKSAIHTRANAALLPMGEWLEQKEKRHKLEDQLDEILNDESRNTPLAKSDHILPWEFKFYGFSPNFQLRTHMPEAYFD